MENNNNLPILTEDDKIRYSRQLLLSELTEESQQKLKSAKILVIGAGGLGSLCLTYLASSGIGTIGIVDGDSVDISNLHRQVIHNNETINLNKAESAKKFLLGLNPTVNINVYPFALSQKNGLKLAETYDMIIDCCDNPETRYISNDIAAILNIPFISGASIRWDGQFSLYIKNSSGKKLPCYRCIHPTPPFKQNIKKCSEVGVMGTIPGVIGILMANEAIKYFANCGEDLGRKLFFFDGLNFSVKIALCRDCRDDCVVCSDKKSITKENFESYDYKAFFK